MATVAYAVTSYGARDKFVDYVVPGAQLAC